MEQPRVLCGCYLKIKWMLFWKRWICSEIDYAILRVNWKRISYALTSFSSPSWNYCSPGIHPYGSLFTIHFLSLQHAANPARSYQLNYLTDPFLSIICIIRCNNMSRLTTPTAQSNAHLQRGGIRLIVREHQLRKKQSTNRLRHGFAM